MICFVVTLHFNRYHSIQHMNHINHHQSLGLPSVLRAKHFSILVIPWFTTITMKFHVFAHIGREGAPARKARKSSWNSLRHIVSRRLLGWSFWTHKGPLCRKTRVEVPRCFARLMLSHVMVAFGDMNRPSRMTCYRNQLVKCSNWICKYKWKLVGM